MSAISDGIGDDGLEQLDENLRKWFKEKWVRFGPDGKIRGPCARGDDSEGKPKCLPQKKAHSIGKKGRKYAASKKRREDPNPERRGKAKNVATKKKSNEDIQVNEKWSQKYKDSINCSNPKGFSQKAHCAGKRKNESMNEEQKCPECGGPMYHESMMNEKKDACYHKVRSRYKVWPSAYASGALVQCRKKGASNWGTGGKKNESSIMKGIVDEGENVLVLYIDGKPSTKYARNHEATADAERLRAKFPNKKIEIKQEVREDENEPETFKKGQQVWLKTRPLPNSPHTGKVYKVGEKFVVLDCSGHLYKARKDNVTGDSKKSYLSTKYPHIKEEQLDELSPETMLKYRKKADDDANYADATGDDARFDKRVKGVMSANRLLRNKKTNETAYEAELDDNEPRIVSGVYGAKSKEFRKKFANQRAQDRFFDHPDREGNYEIHYVQKANVSETDEGDKDITQQSYPYLLAKKNYGLGKQRERAKAELERRQALYQKGLHEGVIVGHDANDPEVAILGGAGTMSLSRLKKKAHSEALQLADDIANGKYSASSYNMKQLHNTLNTIVAAEKEMEKMYFGESPDTSGPVGTQPGGWHRTDMEEDTAYAGGMGQGGNAGQSYRKFKPKSAGTFKEEEQLDEKCWDTHKQVGMKKKGDKMVPNCVPKESAIMKGLKR